MDNDLTWRALVLQIGGLVVIILLDIMTLTTATFLFLAPLESMVRVGVLLCSSLLVSEACAAHWSNPKRCCCKEDQIALFAGS